MSDSKHSNNDQGLSTTARFATRFTGLQRVHGVCLKPPQTEPGKKAEARCWTAKEPVTDALYVAHLEGRAGLGIVPIRDDNTCMWGCIDIDNYTIDHNKLLEKIRQLELPLVVCRTKSGGRALLPVRGRADLPY